MSDTLFPAPEMDALRAQREEYEKLGADARRTVRKNQLLAAGIHPTTKQRLLRSLPEDERVLLVLGGQRLDVTCGDCRFCESLDYHSRSYVKCLAVVQTNGPASDTRKKWPACTKFKKRGRRG